MTMAQTSGCGCSETQCSKAEEESQQPQNVADLHLFETYSDKPTNETATRIQPTPEQMESSRSSVGQLFDVAMKAPPREVEKIPKKPKKTQQQIRISRSSHGQLSDVAMKGPPREVEKIAPLRTIEPCGINAVAEDEWV